MHAGAPVGSDWVEHGRQGCGVLSESDVLNAVRLLNAVRQRVQDQAGTAPAGIGF